MLRELHISNLAVIEDATLTLTPGLNVFTGQTGAGKSLVIGAFEALLGLRKTTDMLRPGSAEGRIAGLFELHDPHTCEELSQALDQPLQPGDELLLTRKLFASGRSTLAANGQPLTAHMLQRAAERLVDIHGQHDHQSLLKPSHQLALLDNYARSNPLRQRFAQLYTQVRTLRETKQQLAAGATLRAQQLDLYEFQAGEIDDADPTHGELAELQARHRILEHAVKLKHDTTACYAALYEQDGSILERLQALAHVLLASAEHDEQLAGTAEQVRTTTLTLQEAAYDLARYADRIDHDPQEAKQVEERLNTLHRLLNKYTSITPRHTAATAPASPHDPLQALLDYRAHLAVEIARLKTEDQDFTTLDGQIDNAARELQTLGKQLTQQRQQAAQELTPRIEQELHQLGMADAVMHVQFTAVDDTPSGQDAVEIMVQTNPGQATRPLRLIASGGELSRVMLALKSTLSDRDRISVLVFDEIDANIGGRLGQTIGQKLRALTQTTTTPNWQGQVLCITHLPQIAAFADHHLRIVKRVQGKGKSATTQTVVEPLIGNARIEELAEMLAGQSATATTRKQARELIKIADGKEVRG